MFHWEPEGHYHFHQCSIENQKGINAVHQCSIENQKGIITFINVPLRTRRALTLFINVPLRTRRALSLSSMFHWEPEGRYNHECPSGFQLTIQCTMQYPRIPSKNLPFCSIFILFFRAVSGFKSPKYFCRMRNKMFKSSYFKNTIIYKMADYYLVPQGTVYVIIYMWSVKFIAMDFVHQ